jgi:hypothetical protein
VSEAEAYPSESPYRALLMGRLLALLAIIELAGENLPRTNTLAYLAAASMTKKKALYYWHQVSAFKNISICH